MRPTLHILSNPYSPVNLNNRMDPFSISTWKFIDWMTSKFGWNCIHYSVVGSDVNCPSIQCLDVIGPDNNENINQYNIRAAHSIGLNKKPGDMALCFYGLANKGAVDAHPDLKVIEPGVGYATNTVFAPYRVFVSYAQQHMYYGEQGRLMNPSWFDTVIPNSFTPDEFDFNPNKGDYFLCFGRVMETKGIHLAIQATVATGNKLVIAGPGSLADMGYPSIPSHVTMMGLCNAEQRRALMRDAKAIIGATYYIEPFGNMVVEGYMSGTPAITTDWGAFPETVVNGETGFRCREFKEFVQAINNIDQINPQTCRDWAINNYSDQVVHEKLNQYLEKINQLDFYRP
jgi:glycosyltransferase involved in cell wall biosynthesis